MIRRRSSGQQNPTVALPSQNMKVSKALFAKWKAKSESPWAMAAAICPAKGRRMSQLTGPYDAYPNTTEIPEPLASLLFSSSLAIPTDSHAVSSGTLTFLPTHRPTLVRSDCCWELSFQPLPAQRATSIRTDHPQQLLYKSN